MSIIKSLIFTKGILNKSENKMSLLSEAHFLLYYTKNKCISKQSFRNTFGITIT